MDNIGGLVREGVLALTRSGSELSLRISGVIGVSENMQDGYDITTTKEKLNEELRAIENIDSDIEKINIFIDSPGGSVFHALAMYHALQKSKAVKYVYYEGVSASAATIIAAIAKKENIYIPEYLSILIHEARNYNSGAQTSNEFEKQAKELRQINNTIAKIYSNQNGLSIEENLKIMASNNGEGLLLSAQEAKDFGFVGNVIEINQNIAAVADFDDRKFIEANWTKTNINKLKLKAMGIFDRKKDVYEITQESISAQIETKYSEFADTVAAEFAEKFSIVEQILEEKNTELTALKEEVETLKSRNTELETAFVDAKLSSSTPKPEIEEFKEAKPQMSIHERIRHELREKQRATKIARQNI